MRVLLTGANGWVGSAIATELLANGHSVVGLVRTAEKAQVLVAQGVTPLLGSIGDLGMIRTAADAADGVIHTAFGLDLSKITQLAREDRLVIEAFGEVYAGSLRPIVVTGGILLTPPGQVVTEASRQPIVPNFPRASEQTAFALAASGLTASVVRLPRSVHGQGERHGFVPMLAALAREKGVSAYIDAGNNLWPSVHRLDAARVFRLALEKGIGNMAFHAIAEEGVAFRHIAQAIGRQLGVPARSLTLDQADTHFGGLAMWVAGNGPASNAHTRTVLGWTASEPGLIADIERPEYQQ